MHLRWQAAKNSINSLTNTSEEQGDKDDIKMGGLEDITAKELEAKFDQLQLRLSSDPRQDTTRQARPIPGGDPPPTAQLNEVYNLKEIDTIWKGVVPQCMREEPTIHDHAE